MSQEKRVRCVETNRVFGSLAAAGRWFGAAGRREGSKGGSQEGAHIGQAARGYRGKRTAGGYHWEFVDKQYPKVEVVRDWSVYTPPVIKPSDPVYSSGRSRVGSDHLRRWVVMSKEVDGKVQCCVDEVWYPTMLVQVAHIRPFASCADEDKYHRDSSLPMSMAMHKLYDFYKFTVLGDGTIKVLDKNCWDELTKLDGKRVLGWREENARFCRSGREPITRAA
tara:strand:+ start:70 stop:735 length:666 start_codon:yes stop_codon:yes gene_type:complete